MTVTAGSRRLDRGLVAATSLGFAVVQLDVSVVNVAIRPIARALGGGVSALQWVVGAYTITFAALILTCGALGDRAGARRVYVVGFTLFTLASMACGAAPGVGALIAARAVQGVGAAILVPCSLTLLRHAHPEPDRRGRAIGLWAAGASLALSGGPLVGGALIAALGWRAIFVINLPLGLLGIALTLRCAEETPRSGARSIDLPGQLAAIVALAALAGSLIEGGVRGESSGPVLAGFALAAVAAAGFVLIERRRSEPMLPPALFAIPTFRSAALIGVIINIAFYGLMFVLSLFFQRAQGMSPLRAGLAFAPMTAVVFAVNIVSGRHSSGRAARPLVVLGALSLAGGSLGLLGADAHTSYSALVAQLVAIGGGLGLIVPIITAALLGSVEPSRAGVAAGTLNSARQSGSVIGVAVCGSLAAGGLVSGLHDSLWLCAAVGIVVIALAPWLRGGD
ncbi:MAG TPA: MFS transporter [Solirubrobacteraceae bacterium]|nr:MFS transporter [Solirubrobacteraceae bacterium]